MPFYNGRRYVEEALNSVRAQSYPNLELIVVDDGSDAENSEQICRLLTQLHVKHAYVKQPNQGIAGAYNRAITLARGELVSFIEQDDVWLPGKLEGDVRYLGAHPNAGMVYSRYWLGDSRGAKRELSQLTLCGSCFRELFQMTLTGPTILPFTAVTIRRSILDCIGPFDEALRISVDYGVWLRVAFDKDIGFVNTPTFVYRIHEGNASKNGVAALEDDRRIIEGWARNREAVRALGKGAVKRRLAANYDDLAFAYARAGNARRAMEVRARQVALAPLSALAWMRLLGAALSPPWRSRLIWYRVRLVGAAIAFCRSLARLLRLPGR
jgi:glycosyltransferase involved in cell wall biosynthesis